MCARQGREVWAAVTPLISHPGSVPPANVYHQGFNRLLLYERGLLSSRLMPLSLTMSVWTTREAASSAGLTVAHGLCSMQGSGVTQWRARAHSLPTDTLLLQHPCTGPEELLPSSAQSPRGGLGFSPVGTHPKEARAAAKLWLMQTSHSLRTVRGLTRKAEGFRHQLRARGGAVSPVSWGGCQSGVCVGSRAGQESLDSCHTPNKPVPPTKACVTPALQGN